MLERDLYEQIGMIHSDVRIDIGFRKHCTSCMKLVNNAMRIAAYNPRIKIHLFQMERLSDHHLRYGASCVPFLMINGRYTFLGERTPRQLLWIIAEAVGKEQ